MKLHNCFKDSFINDDNDYELFSQQFRNQIKNKVEEYCRLVGVENYHMDIDSFLLRVRDEGLCTNWMLLSHIQNDPVFEYMYSAKDHHVSLYKDFLKKSFYSNHMIETNRHQSKLPTSNIHLLVKQRLEERERAKKASTSIEDNKESIVNYYKNNQGREPTQKEIEDLHFYLQDKDKLIGLIIDHGLWKID